MWNYFFLVEWYLLSPNLHLQLYFISSISLSQVQNFTMWLLNILNSRTSFTVGWARMVEIWHRREDIPACTGHLFMNLVLFSKNVRLCSRESSILKPWGNVQRWVIPGGCPQIFSNLSCDQMTAQPSTLLCSWKEEHYSDYYGERTEKCGLQSPSLLGSCF